MPLISCPLCSGPLTLGEPARCLIGHTYEPDDLERRLADEAARALWASVRALEDTARTMRWRLEQSPSSTVLRERAQQAEDQAALLRRVIQDRGDEEAAVTRPPGW